jgi:hypothetical protein
VQWSLQWGQTAIAAKLPSDQNGMGSEISDKFSMAAAAEFEGSGTRILRDPEFEFTKTLEPR